MIPSTSSGLRPATEIAEEAEAIGRCVLCLHRHARAGSVLCRHCERVDICRARRLFGERHATDIARFYSGRMS